MKRFGFFPKFSLRSNPPIFIHDRALGAYLYVMTFKCSSKLWRIFKTKTYRYAGKVEIFDFVVYLS